MPQSSKKVKRIPKWLLFFQNWKPEKLASKFLKKRAINTTCSESNESSDSSDSEQVVFMVPRIRIEPPGPILPFFLKIDLIIKMILPQPLLTFKRIYMNILMKWRVWGRNHPLKFHVFLFFHISIVAYLQPHILNAYSYFKLLKIDA